MTTAMNMDWDDLRIVLAICRECSLTGAARVLGTSHSTVFRQINKIEKKFATRFFNRLPHGYEMTEAGELVLHKAGSIEDEILELRRELQGKDLRLQGNIRLTAPEGVSHYILMPHIASFYEEHPDVTIELKPSSVIFEMGRSEVDLAIRMTDTPPQNCIAKKICDFKMGLYACDAYLQNVGDKAVWEYEYVLCLHYLQALSRHVWKGNVIPHIKFSSDNILSVANAAKAGLGATVLPCLIGEKEPTLKRIHAPGIEEFSSEIWILMHSDLRQTLRVKALMNHLYEGMQTEIKYAEGLS
ncbi:MAG: LysR family transcriptional regulator [Gammaproteobacteria bacterium]|nr:LysR family transcriptional regulator [Gammaproteobacteria bacterium]